MYDYAVTVHVNIYAFVDCVSKLYKKNEKNFLLLIMRWMQRWVVICKTMRQIACAENEWNHAIEVELNARASCYLNFLSTITYLQTAFVNPSLDVSTPH